MKLGLLTGGGDAPGLNGIIESVARCLLNAGHELLGICDGFEGIFESRTIEIKERTVLGIHSHSGTLLGTSNKSGTKGREQEFLSKYEKLGVDGLIVAGGDGTFAGLKNFFPQIKIIGVPKTIDNDLAGTEICFGYDTACSVVAESADALRYSADAHRRIMIIETMGRTAGWIALGGGLTSYADIILIPERPFERRELLEYVKGKKSQGNRGLIIVAAEGAHALNEDPTVAFQVAGSPQAERYGGIASALARWLEKETAWEARHVVLGHLQRSHAPTTTDRFLTLSMGVQVAQMVKQGAWKQAVVYREGRVTQAPLEDLMQPAKLVTPDHRWVQLAKALDIFI